MHVIVVEYWIASGHRLFKGLLWLMLVILGTLCDLRVCGMGWITYGLRSSPHVVGCGG